MNILWLVNLVRLEEGPKDDWRYYGGGEMIERSGRLERIERNGWFFERFHLGCWIELEEH